MLSDRASADETVQFFSPHPIIYRPTHQKNRTPTGGVSPVTRTLIPVSYFLNREKSHFLKFQGSGVKDSGNTQKCSVSVFSLTSSEKGESPNPLWIRAFIGSGAWDRTKDLVINSHPLYR